MVIARVREHVAEPVGQEDGAETEGQAGREDEAVPAREGDGGDDADAADGDGAEEECLGILLEARVWGRGLDGGRTYCHSSEDWRGDGD